MPGKVSGSFRQIQNEMTEVFAHQSQRQLGSDWGNLLKWNDPNGNIIIPFLFPAAASRWILTKSIVCWDKVASES